jgi:hypothetical protein
VFNFLSFESFIAPYFFIFFYYFGAFFIPILLLINRFYFMKKFPFIYNFCEKVISGFKALPNRKKITYILFFTFMFIFLEILWRVGFEFIIGYFQIVENMKRV